MFYSQIQVPIDDQVPSAEQVMVAVVSFVSSNAIPASHWYLSIDKQVSEIIDSNLGQTMSRQTTKLKCRFSKYRLTDLTHDT